MRFGFEQSPARFAVLDSGPLNRWWEEIPIGFELEILTPREFNERALNRIRKLAPYHLKALGKLLFRIDFSDFLEAQKKSKFAFQVINRIFPREHLLFSNFPSFEATGSANAEDLQQVVAHVKAIAGVQGRAAQNKEPRIVIIDRRVIPSFYVANEGADYGPNRRSIPNLGQVAESLSGLGEVRILSPEHLPIPEIIQELSEADVLVGQHGAGLSNMVWMNQKGLVFEISDKERPHFRELAAKARLSYKLLICQESTHGPVDISLVRDSIQMVLTDTPAAETTSRPQHYQGKQESGFG